MSDKELLELAAKAAGVATIYWVGDLPVTGEGMHQEPIFWNPLTDDGDALRLAVKLQMSFDRAGNVCAALADGQMYEEQAQDFNGDPYAATRRAIVRAAAELAKEQA